MPYKSAPDFTLFDQNGRPLSLVDYRGRWVVIYFYPSDRALDCTKEACNFRDEYHIIAQFGNAEIKKFVTRNHLNFPILSDPNHKVTSAFGAWRSNQAHAFDKMYGTRRNTYLINPDGQIVKSYLSVDPKDNPSQIINDLQSLQQKTALPPAKAIS
jgi:peroxiredoxin Q/BCP